MVVKYSPVSIVTVVMVTFCTHFLPLNDIFG